MMNPQLIAPLVMAPLIVFGLYRRVRSQFGRQPIRRKRMVARIAIFAVLGVLIAATGLHDIRVIGGMVGGVLGGAVLGLIGLRLTRFERGADGSDAYIPNPWLGALLTALLIGRLAWRFAVLAPAAHQGVPPTGPDFGNSPLTLAVFGLLIGYYLCYFGGLLIHHTRFVKSHAAGSPL